MSETSESVLSDEATELHNYAREFFRIQIVWIFLVGLANLAGLALVFAHNLGVEATVKPPICVGFVLLNLATAVQCFVRRLDYQILGSRIDQVARDRDPSSSRPRRPSVFPLAWSVRTTTLYTLLSALLAVSWLLSILHIWRHEDAPAWEYYICLGVLAAVGAVFGVMLVSQVARGRRQLQT